MTTPDEGRTATVAFIDHHRPAMPAGAYTIEVEQAVSGPDIPLTTFKTTRTFTVAGDPYTLLPTDVYTVFPPEGSLGDHSHVLPHIVLDRSTLPWELSADGKDTPWLALLLFTEEDSLPGIVTKQQFLARYGAADGAGLWTHLRGTGIGWLTAMPGQADTALVVPRGNRAAPMLAAPYTNASGTADAILDGFRGARVTTLGELVAASTSQVDWPGLRIDPTQRTAADQVTVLDVPTALLTAQLPPAAGLRLLTHVRRATDAAGDPIGEDRAVVVGRRLPHPRGISEVHLVSVADRYANGAFRTGKTPYTRLISLKSWRFACADPAGDFTGLLTGLDRRPSTLRLPGNPDAEAEAHLAAGRVPVPHRLRGGGTTVSWYRGPLLPDAPAGEPVLPAVTAGDLVRYDDTRGMFDVSWAAAWELGRLLALSSKPLARSLYAWKRAQGRAGTGWILHPSWSAAGDTAPRPPKDIVDWFDGLRLLRGVPLGYLVPDERMLPPESIRFVRLDPGWLDCLIDGAFSIGRLTGRVRDADLAQGATLADHLSAHPAITGFLLRSAAVAGWPGLHADAYAGSAPLPAIRFERLTPEILLCLFDGEADRVQLHQAPETLHFGLTDRDGDWRRNRSGVVDLATVAAARGLTGTTSSGAFAAALVEGVPRITYTRAAARSRRL